MPGPVPPCFWEEVAHRRDYLLWSAHRLGFRAMEDFYRLSLSACYEQNFGPGVERYWGYSASKRSKIVSPEYDWKPWLFKRVSKGFWDSPANRRSYMDWLGQRSDISARMTGMRLSTSTSCRTGVRESYVATTVRRSGQ